MGLIERQSALPNITDTNTQDFEDHLMSLSKEELADLNKQLNKCLAIGKEIVAKYERRHD